MLVRHEIQSVHVPKQIQDAMDRQSIAEREKRSKILKSEGDRQASINAAEGQRLNDILRSEGSMQATVNAAKAEQESMNLKTEATALQIKQIGIATASAIEAVASAIQSPGGQEAVASDLIKRQVEAFANVAKAGTTMLLPHDGGDPASVIARMYGSFTSLRETMSSNAKNSDKVVAAVYQQKPKTD